MKCPACGYENAQGVQVCNSCARLLPKMEAGLRAPPGAGSFPSKFTVRARSAFGGKGLNVVGEGGQVLFHAMPSGFFGSKGFDVTPERTAGGAFRLRPVKQRFLSEFRAYRVEDSSGILIGSVRRSPFGWSSSLILETDRGTIAKSRRAPPMFLISLLLRLIPYVGPIAEFLPWLGTARAVQLYVDGHPAVTYRRTLRGTQVELHQPPEKLDPRLAMAGALALLRAF